MFKPLWRPSPERVAASKLEEFRLLVPERFGREIVDYAALHAWSIAEPADFWRLLAEFARLPFEGSSANVISDDPMPYTRWFPDVRVNYARAMLYPAALLDPQQPALISEVEDGATTTLSYTELRALVAAIQRSMAELGVGKDDVVAAFTANISENVALLLACAGLGAVYTSCSPDFGAAAAAARFSQLDVKALFATTGYRYGGRWFDTSTTVSRLQQALSGASATVPLVRLPYPGVADPGADDSEPHTARLNGSYDWDEFLALGETPAAGSNAEPYFEPLPFDHPLYVLYSSGTTGPPKAMVHRAGGVLLTHLKEHLLHCDIRPADKVFYFTTCGWMMFNWLVSALASAATVVLYDGSPSAPDLERPFALAQRYEVNFLGISARFLHTLRAEGARPAARFDLAALRTLASTGSPLSPAGFEYVYQFVKDDVHLASISGGTDIVGCFMLGVPTLPVYAGELQGPGLGVDLAIFGADGGVVDDEPGELVCRQPLPSMPLRFVGDPEFRRYHDSYFGTYQGVWRHGDVVERDSRTGGYVVHGRSDATLNPGGVRIGTAEIYRALEVLPEVLEAAAVGRRNGADEVIWLLVVLRDGAILDQELVGRIRAAIRHGASPRHLPAKVLAVPSLPRTRSGKPMEIAVARLVNGQPVPNVAVIANPESLTEISAVLAADVDN